MERLSRKFSAPRSADVAQWKKVQFLVEHGFRFYSVYEATASGGKQSVRYLSTLEEAKDFVVEFREQAVLPAASYLHVGGAYPVGLEAGLYPTCQSRPRKVSCGSAI